ncbi:MAG: hypothetical protein KME17_13520 [Cyanosarcina radialis HA8281-LM2]|nr:hypothetical protein [Cyanosarcina radialis HA8281-LM2]
MKLEPQAIETEPIGRVFPPPLSPSPCPLLQGEGKGSFFWLEGLRQPEFGISN